MSSFEDVRAFLARHPIKMPNDTPEPQVGQVWRAAWDNVSLDVYLAEVGEDTVVVLPVSPHSDVTQSPDTYFIEGDESPLGYAATVWANLQAELPSFVLDGCYGTAPTELEESQEPAQSELVEAARTADARTALRSQIHEQVEELAAATWRPEEAAIGPIRQLMQDRGLTLRDVSDRTSLPEAILRRINRGAWWLTPVRVSELVSALEVSESELPRSDPFGDKPNLLRTISSPRRRPALRRLADKMGTSEKQVRLDAAHQLLAAAGRDVSEGDPDSRERWEQLLDLYLSNA